MATSQRDPSGINLGEFADGQTDKQTDAHGLCLGRLGWDRLFVWGAVAFGAAAAAGGGGRRKGGPFGSFQGGSDQGRPPPQWQGS